MKSLTYFLNSFIGIVVFLFVVSTSTQAQNLHYRDPYNPAKGYWKLFTDAATRTTNVKFYDIHHTLLYEEVIPEKYIKLTNRNINKLNEAFDQVTGNRFVQTKVKSNSLPVISGKQFIQQVGINNSNLDKANSRTLSNSGIIINGFKYARNTNYCLIFKNPARKSVNVTLKDEEGKVLYSEYLSIANYHRIFNFKGLSPGGYTLIVATTDHKYKYTEQLTISPSTQTLQVEPVNSPFEASSASNF